MWENSKLHGNLNNHKTVPPGAPLTYFNDGGGGGEKSVIFFGLKFWPKVIFWVSMKDTGIFWGLEKETVGFLGGCVKRTFLGHAQK